MNSNITPSIFFFIAGGVFQLALGASTDHWSALYYVFAGFSFALGWTMFQDQRRSGFMKDVMNRALADVANAVAEKVSQSTAEHLVPQVLDDVIAVLRQHGASAELIGNVRDAGPTVTARVRQAMTIMTQSWVG